METITYSIPNISCNHCVMHVKTRLSSIEGVESVQGDPATKQVVVEFFDPATDEEIRAALQEINYPAE